MPQTPRPPPGGGGIGSIFGAIGRRLGSNVEAEQRQQQQQKQQRKQHWGRTSDVYAPSVFIPGRESHTSDVGAFDLYLRDALNQRREDEETGKVGPWGRQSPEQIAEGQKFWSYVRSVLQKASEPVGFGRGEEDADAGGPMGGVVQQGPKDAERFFERVVATSVLNPIHPIRIAEETEVSYGTVLAELLHASRAGLVRMRWAPSCDRCGSMACTSETLGGLGVTAVAPSFMRGSGDSNCKDGPIRPVKVLCEGCRYVNTVDCLKKIKVVFDFRPDILFIPAKSFACKTSSRSMDANEMFVAVPAATIPGRGFRYSVGCGEDGMRMRENLLPGRYRMRCPIAGADAYLRVRRETKPNDEPFDLEVRVSELVVPTHERGGPLWSIIGGRGGPTKTLHAPHGRINFDVYTDTGSFFMLWVQRDLDDKTLMHLPEEERADYTDALSVMAHPTFQELYSHEADKRLYHALSRMVQVGDD